MAITDFNSEKQENFNDLIPHNNENSDKVEDEPCDLDGSVNDQEHHNKDSKNRKRKADEIKRVVKRRKKDKGQNDNGVIVQAPVAKNTKRRNKKRTKGMMTNTNTEKKNLVITISEGDEEIDVYTLTDYIQCALTGFREVNKLDYKVNMSHNY